jgi:hypothetical protein
MVLLDAVEVRVEVHHSTSPATSKTSGTITRPLPDRSDFARTVRGSYGSPRRSGEV